ncbi:hypothetical protein [Bacillus taeanensis]|uniref:Aspartyl protease n=1 Tax=Bacillus taeanensis TaxID=273032 RepID=A0A366XRR3_9BACI|nr:hypothetical protein [Bacillus taeanensis]RBW68587.1 hypothetical protein DS031_15615 [Bacillus taeanensis]
MKIRLENGLPIAELEITHNGKTIVLENVLLDTGCAATIFDTDLLAEIDVELDIINGKSKRMYGVGGYSELCYEQNVKNVEIDGQKLDLFLMQLGMTKDLYDFDGILGIDFMLKTGMMIDFKELVIKY